MIDRRDMKNQILLGDLSERELDAIAPKIQVASYEKGKPIFKEGEATGGIYLVNKGRVEISKVTADGWKQTLAVLAKNHFFGELSVIEDKKTHGADATAIDDTEIVCITTADIKALEQSEPVIMYKILKTIARVASRNVHSMNERLMKLLISY